jgi:uncharacterized membrane protein (UPF0127 family)
MLMKKLMLALFLMFGGIAVVNAQDTTATPTQTTPTQDQERTQIQISELPEAVTTALESQDYSGWTVASAYRSTQKDSSDETKSMEVYVVELKNGAETKSVRFDKDGNKLDDEGKDKK